MDRECIAFEMDDPIEAKRHMELEVIRDYGASAHGHALHCWDEGSRCLAKCQNCGGYVLIQSSEFHGMEDDYYTDFFPVCGEEEAEELNRRYDGFTIEHCFPRKYLMMTNLRLHWSKAAEAREHR